MKKILLITVLFVTGLSFGDTKTSSTHGDWNDTSTWGGSLPAAGDDIVIAHNVVLTASDDRSANSVTVNAGKTLTLNSVLTVATTSATVGGGKISISATGSYTQTAGNFTNEGIIDCLSGSDLVFLDSGTTFTNSGQVNMYSSDALFSSFVLSGTYTDSSFLTFTKYSRYIASTANGWDLIGSPLENQSISDFQSTNNDIATNGSAYAIGTYTNTSEAASAGTTWTNYTTSTIGGAGNFTLGIGYQMATVGGAEVFFEGEVKTSSVSVLVTTNEEGSTNVNGADGTKFALIANPYASYVDVTSFLNAHKTTQLHTSHIAIYGWDGSNYDTYSLASPGNNVAPGQGFMIGVKGADGTQQTITFTNAMKTASGTGDYHENDPMEDDRAELFINLNQNGSDKETKLFFLEQGTDGLNPGYDAATMDIGNYSIYSRLVADDEGVNMDHQSLAYSEMWNNKVIPLGINALAGEEITLGISHLTTPADLNIYLEDALEGTMTDIKAGDYTLIPSSDINGVGRFFVHITADTMSNGEVSTSMLNAFKEVNANYITIEGLATQSNNINVSLYNILGRKVLDTSLNNNINTQTVSTLGMASGIYVIELESGNDRLTKKLIIQ
jgi:hypothetical protein